MANPDATFATKEGRIKFCQDCLQQGYLDLAVRELMKHPAFDIKNPNRVRALIGAFSGNHLRFHGADGEGYRLVGEVIRILDEDTVDHFCKTHTGVLDACIHTSECGIRPVIVGLHEIVQNALSEITLAELVGTEAKVDARLHQIQKLQAQLGPVRTIG